MFEWNIWISNNVVSNRNSQIASILRDCYAIICSDGSSDCSSFLSSAYIKSLSPVGRSATPLSDAVVSEFNKLIYSPPKLY